MYNKMTKKETKTGDLNRQYDFYRGRLNLFFIKLMRMKQIYNQ